MRAKRIQHPNFLTCLSCAVYEPDIRLTVPAIGLNEMIHLDLCRSCLSIFRTQLKGVHKDIEVADAATKKARGEERP